MNTLRNVLTATALAMLLGSGSAIAKTSLTYDEANNTVTVTHLKTDTMKGGDYEDVTRSEGIGYSGAKWVDVVLSPDTSGCKSCVPEIDVSSSISAATILTGVLTLAWKRSRSRQAVKSS